MKINIIPIPGFKNYVLGKIYCRDLKPVNKVAIDIFRNYLIEKLKNISEEALKHYRESIRIGRMLGVDDSVIKSIHLFLGLLYQLPTALYDLYLNQGYSFSRINPYYCIGYVLSDDLVDEGIHVDEVSNGTWIGYRDGRSVYMVDPALINAIHDRIIGFSYLVIDGIVSGEVDLKLLEIIRDYGEENYYYLCHLLIRRIGEVMDNVEYPNIIVGLRVKEIYRMALKTINIYKHLIPYDRIAGKT